MVRIEPQVPRKNYKAAKKFHDEVIRPLVLAALKKEGLTQETFPNIKMTAVADAGETIRVVMDDREVFDVTVKVDPWVDPNLVYM